MNRASYVPDLAPYRDARNDARAAIFLVYLNEHTRRVYTRVMRRVAYRAIRAGYAFHADARFMLQTGRTVRALRAARNLVNAI